MSAACLLANANNAVPAATVTASSVLPATQTIFRRPGARAGNGQVILSGGFVGANDSAIDIEIRPGSGSGVRVSQPVFAGAGNGVMTQPSATAGTDSQDITVSLIDIGTKTTYAQAVLYGDILLRAKASGSDGNALKLTITPTLTLSAAPIGALSVALSKDTAEWTDQRGDFGAVPLDPDGTLPANAPRLVFANDRSRVYRHYKRWDGTQWQYGLSPKLAADHAIGAPVHTVSGSYAVTLADGVTTETYQNLITLYDLLVALSLSLRVEVVGVIANDRKPGGLAAMDVPIRSSAFVLPPVASRPERMPGLRDVSVSPTAKTETLTVECLANSPIGRERWAVRSTVTSALPDAVTGTRYEGDVQFLIPPIPRDSASAAVAGAIAITDRNFPRGAEDKTGIPAICLYRPALGAKASSKTLKLVWTQRPPADCDCMAASVRGLPNGECLGITPQLEGGVAMALVADYQTRLVALYAWLKSFVASNTLISAKGEVRSDGYDIELAETVTGILASGLADLFAETDTPTPAALIAWTAVMDGLPDDFNTLRPSELDYLTGPSMDRLYNNGSYAAGDIVQIGVFLKNPDAQDAGNPVVYAGVVYSLCVVSGTAAVSNPNFLKMPELGEEVEFAGPRFRIISREEAYRYAAEKASTSSITAIAPAPWEAGIARDPATFAKRYLAAMNHVRALAGLVPKSEASRQGGACWPALDDPYYWQIEGTGYLPVFNNVYYHSVVLDTDGKPLSTYEFGFGLRVACAERLKAGDTLTIAIGAGTGVATDYPYQIGDTYRIPVIGTGPLHFAGGVTGSDTLTWSVVSSMAGPLPDYALTLSEPAYSGGGLGFAIHRGGLPFALGDQYRFTVEIVRQWRARRDGGAWLADAAMADSALADGLNVAFVSGVAPSFESGDLYQFLVRQPHSPTHIKSAHGETWRWSGSTATLTLTWTSDQVVSVIGLLRHGLRAPASVAIELKDALNAVLTTLTPAVKAGPLVIPLLSTLTTVRSLTVTVTDAPGMSLGWVYAGVPLATRHHPRVTLKRAYSIERAEGINPRGTYLGGGRGGEIRWENWLLQNELDALLALVDDCKADGDAPMVLLPHTLHPQDAALVRIETDAIAVDDYFDYQPNDTAKRRLSLTLPLAAVLS